MRPQQQRYDDGPPDPREEAVRGFFRARHRLLVGLFPENGEAMAARACASACAIVNSKALRGSAPEVIAERVVACHHLGLEVGDQASLVPFKADVQLIVGPRGLIALAFRSGFLKSIISESVFEPDYFDYMLGDEPYIKHRKAPWDRRQTPIVAAYAVVETTTGGKERLVLTREDLDYYQSFSKAPAEVSPWTTNYEGMVRKTVIKRIMEYVPRSPLMAAALRENEVGGYEIPAEMWEEAKARARTDGRTEVVQAFEAADGAAAGAMS